MRGRNGWVAAGLLVMAACGGVAVIDPGGGGGASAAGSGGSTATASNAATQMSASTGPLHACDDGYVPCCQAACQAAIDLGCELGPRSIDECGCEVMPGNPGCNGASLAWFRCIADTPNAFECDDSSFPTIVCDVCDMERSRFEVACDSATNCGGF